MTVISNRPAQPLAYHRGDYPLDGYARPGALAITIGRDEDQAEEFRAISAAGGTVLAYLDPVIDNPYGRYHQLLHEASELGPATARWPGDFRANQWGYLADFRPGSIVQQKWERVLRRVLEECPHLGGFFVDDCGSRSWFAGVPWESWSVGYQQAYRDGAIELLRTARRVADEHGLVVLVNGTWGAGTLAKAGGGYPDLGQHGCSLADGGMVENHPASEIAYWREYCTGPQWAAESPITRGAPVMVSTNRSRADRDALRPYVSHAEATDDYADGSAPSLPFHPTGLPTRVRDREEEPPMPWRVARSLDVLLEQLNRRYPTRSKASDGSIGDAAHSSRTSDHNPDAGGVVRARDFTHDPAAGVDIDRLSDELAASRDPRIKYVIAKGLIMDSRPGFSQWQWVRYTGSNPHTRHLHLSVVAGARADDVRPWNLPMLAAEEDEMPTPTAREIADAILDTPIKRKGDTQDPDRGPTSVRAIFEWWDHAAVLGRQASEDAAAQHEGPTAEEIAEVVRTIVREELAATPKETT